MKSSIIKAEEITDITNATIVNYKTVKFLENKLKKTLKEIWSLDKYYIMKYYEISSESLTKDFILKYEDFNHIR